MTIWQYEYDKMTILWLFDFQKEVNVQRSDNWAIFMPEPTHWIKLSKNKKKRIRCMAVPTGTETRSLSLSRSVISFYCRHISNWGEFRFPPPTLSLIKFNVGPRQRSPEVWATGLLAELLQKQAFELFPVFAHFLHYGWQFNFGLFLYLSTRLYSS